MCKGFPVPSGVSKGLLGLPRLPGASCGLPEPPGTSWGLRGGPGGILGPSAASWGWGILNPLGVFWDHFCPPGTSWGLAGPSGAS